MTFDANAHLSKVQGRDYLEVKWRLVWLNEEADRRFRIETEALALEADYAVVRASVAIVDASGAVIKAATGMAREDRKGFTDFVEKAETAAVGRALGMLGYGTQFAGELDEQSTPASNGTRPAAAAPSGSQPAATPGARRQSASGTIAAIGPEGVTLEGHTPAPWAASYRGGKPGPELVGRPATIEVAREGDHWAVVKFVVGATAAATR